MKYYIIAAAVLCLALIGGAAYFTVQAQKPNTARILPIDPSYTTRQKDGGWVEGAATAPVTLEEYGDYQCPACGELYQPLKDSLSQNKDAVRYIFRNYPLSQHNKAQQAALAAESAGRQGKFWQMHDLLYQNQSEWSDDTTFGFGDRLDGYAKSIGLNVEQFDRDIQDPSTAAEISKDVAKGNTLPITATPTLVVNGKTVQSITPTTSFLNQLIQQAAQHGTAG